MGNGEFCTSPESKLLNQSTPNFERLINSVRERELPNLIQIGSTGASPHVGEMYNLCVFSSPFRRSGYRPQFATDFDVLWLKRFGLAQVCAFWVSKVLKVSVRGSKSSKSDSVGKSQPKIPYKFVINLKNLKFTLNVRTIITLRKQQKLFLHDFVAISAR